MMDVVQRLQKEDIEYQIIEDTVHIEMDDLFKSQIARLELEPEKMGVDQRIKMIDFYAGEADTSIIHLRWLDHIVDVLAMDHSKSLESLTDRVGDLFYERLRTKFPMMLNKNPAPYISGRSRPLLNNADGGTKAATKRINYRKAALRRSATNIVKKVAEYFDVDLPERINVGEAKGNYASIRYNRRGFFMDSEKRAEEVA